MKPALRVLGGSRYTLPMNKIAALAAAAVLAALAVTANAADHKPAAEAAKGPVEATIIILGDVSVPVVNGKKVRRYEYAAVGLKVNDVAKQKPIVCDRKFQLADALLLYTHGHPFAQGNATEGTAAKAAMLEIAKQVIGADVVGGLDLTWAANPQPLQSTIFGRTTDILCTSK